MPKPQLIAHWPLSQNAQDLLGRHHGVARGVRFVESPAGGAAEFDGVSAEIEVPDAPGLQLGSADFTAAAWIQCRRPMRGAPGDVLSKFDPVRRCGVNFWVSGGAAGYASFSDARHVHAGIDDGYMGEWVDHGRPEPTNPLISALTVWRGGLYASGTDASTPGESGKVYRWLGGKKWEDCGRPSPDPTCPGVMSMIVHDGALYAGTGSWDWGRADDSRKSASPSAWARVYRYEGGTTWRDLGPLPTAQRVLCLASFNGELYAGLDRGAQGRCLRFDGKAWHDCGVLDDKDNFECLMPVAGVLYGASHFAVYRYEGGQKWTCIGRRPFGISQIHSFQVVESRLWIGTWPQGYILRHEGGDQWSNTGLVGLATDKPGVAPINEVNSLAMHHGKVYAGVLPKAQIYRYEADGQWTLLGSFASSPAWDSTQTPTWMRVLSIATHRGRLFACTGASQARSQDVDADGTAGRVVSCQTGAVASHEEDIGGAWTHVAMTRRGREVKLFINGKLSHRAASPRGSHFDLGNASPLRIGSGPQSRFDGSIRDVRLYAGALGASAVLALASR